MQLRVLALERRQQIGEITEREFCVQSSRDVQFSGAFGNGLRRDFQTVVDVVRVRVGLARRAKEPAELAIRVTDVSRIQVAIDVEISGASVPPSANRIGEFT